jgi:hypothetical protein
MQNNFNTLTYNPATIKIAGGLKTITMLSHKFAPDSKVRSAVFDVEVNCAEKKYRVPGQTKAYSEKNAGGKLVAEIDRPKDWVTLSPTAPMAFICK